MPNVMTTQPPAPDWQKSEVILVDPTIWKHYQRAKCDLRPVYRDLQQALDSLGIEYLQLTTRDSPLDIWIRDWGFVGDCYFQYPPSYAKSLYSQRAVQKARQHLDIFSGKSHSLIPMVFDGGNLAHDGKVGILTEKVLADNPRMTKREIEECIISLGFERVVFIPMEPEDIIGHSDGIVRFVSPEVLLVNEYTGRDLKDYQRQFNTALKRAKLHAELLPFPWFTTGEMNEDGMWSAQGCYINFLQTAKGIVCPVFNHKLDERALGILQAHTNLPVVPVNATELARQGGVFNCASLT
jgi:agmatine deiminase